MAPSEEGDGSEFGLDCPGCRRPRIFLFQNGRIRTERDPQLYPFCLSMIDRGGEYEEVATLFNAATDYVHKSAYRGAAVLLRATTELFLAFHLLGDVTTGRSLDGFGPMIGRFKRGENAASGFPTADRDTFAGYLDQIMALGDTAAHPRIHPPPRKRDWTRGHVLEDMDNFEKIVKGTVVWCKS